VLFTATYPERVEALILWGTFAGGGRHPEEDYGQTEAWRRGWQILEECIGSWGQGKTLEMMAPSIANGPIERRLRGLFERAAASPSMARALFEAAHLFDVRKILPAVRVPTLVLHRVGDFIPVDAGKYLADHIEGARFVALPGSDHLPWVGDPGVVEEIETVVAGPRAERAADESLMTVLFTDVVDSTRHAVAMGDAAFRDLLERHEAMVRAELDRFAGHAVDSAGDGFFMVFDGPAWAIACARALVDGAKRDGLQLRAGIHAGECVLRAAHVRGLTVHIGARVASLAQPGEILLTSVVKDITVGAGYRLVDRGKHVLKGVPGEWHLFAVAAEAPATTVVAAEKLGPVDRAVTGIAGAMPAVARRLVGLIRPK
jgi:class 3 adenylate cyclase